MTIFKPSTRSGDFLLEIALGNVADYKAVNKFGHAPDADSGVGTDVWDGADGLTSTDIWVAPTAARVHALVSSDAADAAAGTGMRSIQVRGLTSWAATAETRETVILNGTTPVNTTKSYVIIYRMLGITFGSSATNAGIIKATAAVDSTITAVVQIANGQTLMAIYGVPAMSRFCIRHLHMDMLGNAAASGTGRLVVETRADTTDGGERLLREWNLHPTDSYNAAISPPIMIEGPAIVKLQVVTDTNNSAVTGSFDGVEAKTQHTPDEDT